MERKSVILPPISYKTISPKQSGKFKKIHTKIEAVNVDVDDAW
jgi:hypothetical protein